MCLLTSLIRVNKEKMKITLKSVPKMEHSCLNARKVGGPTLGNVLREGSNNVIKSSSN